MAYENSLLKPGRSARSERQPLWLSLGSSLVAGVNKRQKPITGDMKDRKIHLCVQNLPWLEQKTREDQAQAWFASSDFRKAIAKVNSAQRMEFLEAEQPGHKEKKGQPMIIVMVSNPSFPRPQPRC